MKCWIRHHYITEKSRAVIGTDTASNFVSMHVLTFHFACTAFILCALFSRLSLFLPLIFCFHFFKLLFLSSVFIHFYLHSFYFTDFSWNCFVLYAFLLFALLHFHLIYFTLPLTNDSRFFFPFHRYVRLGAGVGYQPVAATMFHFPSNEDCRSSSVPIKELQLCVPIHRLCRMEHHHSNCFSIYEISVASFVGLIRWIVHSQKTLLC